MTRRQPTPAQMMEAQDAAARACREWARAADHAEYVYTMEAFQQAAVAKKAWRQAAARVERMEARMAQAVAA